MSTVAFSPDGRWVAGGTGSTAQIWLWRPEDLTAEACTLLPRNLTWGEWQQYLGGEPYHQTCDNLPPHPSAVEGLVAYAEAYVLDGDIQAASLAYAQAVQWAGEINYAWLYHTLCHSGSLHEFGELVLPICEQAVELAPHKIDYREGRGLARALTGDYAGAVEDFRFYVEWWQAREWCVQDKECIQRISEWETWITELEAGQNPFDEFTLDELRNE